LRSLFDPSRHEPLRDLAWDESRARATIERVLRDTETRFDEDSWWPIHPLDADGGEAGPLYPLYFGACGVVWALHYLEAVGAVRLSRRYADVVERLLPQNRAWLGAQGSGDVASYLMGDTPILMLRQWLDPRAHVLDRLQRLIAGNVDHPTRELMWGAPGTMLAAYFLHERTGEKRWADLFRRSARTLESRLLHSPECDCDYWTQYMYGERTTYLDAVHGFVGTALPLIRGRHLLDAKAWRAWEQRIAETVAHTATREGPLANWRTFLLPDREAGSDPHSASPPMLMQYCHGAPGFVVCLGGFPAPSLDELLLAGGEATWAAGPLRKGSNLCHGTAGNGYAFLKLHERTKDPQWLARARAFAMHAIVQCEDDAMRYGQMRYSLWTGDLGLAIYLWNCIRGSATFPTLDVFFA
jgi:lanthionine synthetase-like protein